MRTELRRGFTLIEMLAVVLIIAILGAMIMPALHNAHQRSRIVKAQAETRELMKALEVYWSTYHDWSGLGSGGSMTAEKVAILSGENLNGDNPREIQFMEFPPEAEEDGFRDPWGSLYRYAVEIPEDVEDKWHYATRVYCANRKREEL